MRRLSVLLALAVALLGAPALAAPRGTLVIVTNGRAAGTVTLPKGSRFDFYDTTLDTASQYTVVTVTQGAKYLGYVGRFPGKTVDTSLFDSPQGRVTLRVLTAGRTTITVPATGFSGRRVVTLSSPLRGATATFGSARVVANTVRNVLPFTTAGKAHVFQGYTSGRPLADEEIYTFCLSQRGEDCQESGVQFWRGDATGAHVTYEPSNGGALDSHLTLTATGLLLDPVTHYVLTVPVA